MSLKPHVQQIISQLPKMEVDAFTLDNISQIRSSGLLGAENVEKPELFRIEDMEVRGRHHDITVRVYTPVEQARYIGILAIHGGGWTLGSIDTHDVLFRKLALATGAKVISVDYSLSPEYKYPMGLEDCYDVFTWIAQKHNALQIDIDKLVVAGDSAGGNLSAALTHMAKAEIGAPSIWKQVLLYPAVDMNKAGQVSPYASIEENKDAPILTKQLMQAFYAAYTRDEQDGLDPYLSPIHATSFDGLPPALIVTAQYDPLRDEGEAYATKLASAGVDVEVVRVDGVPHGFMSMPIPEVDDILSKIATFLTI